jgi:O-antigen/teichoic acid export membrane protein
MSLLQRAGKNISWLFLSEICSRGITFFATLYLARRLGTEGFGLYTLVLTVATYLWGIADIGVTGYGLREVARDRHRAGELLNTLNSMRIFMAVFVILLLAIVLFFLDIPVGKKYIFLIGSLYLFTYSISPDWVLQGLEEMKYLAIGKIATSLFFLTVILLFVYNPSDIFMAVLFCSISYLLGGILFLFILNRKFKINFTPSFSPAHWWTHLKESFFFFLGGNITNLGRYIPIFLMGILSTDAQLGIFSAPYRIIEMVFLTGNIVTTAIYPMLSNLYLKDVKAFQSLHATYQNIVLFIGLPLAIGCMLLSDDIILLLFGQGYQGSDIIMKVMVWLVPFSLLRLNYGRTLLSANFHRFNSIALGIGAVVTVVLCLLLIPRYGGVGAAWAMVAGEAVMLLMMKWISSLKLGTASLINNYFLKISIANILAGIIFLKLPFPVLINILLGAVSYGALAFILGIISKEKIMKVLKG